MKAPHYELQLQYLADITQTVWGRPNYSKLYSWNIFENAFIWLPDWEYHIGPTPPEQPKMCALGGMKFPRPESVSPEIGTEIYVAFNTGPQAFKWRTGDLEDKWLELRIVHLDAHAAEQHSAALRAVNMQAVENAK